MCVLLALSARAFLLTERVSTTQEWRYAAAKQPTSSVFHRRRSCKHGGTGQAKPNVHHTVPLSVRLEVCKTAGATGTKVSEWGNANSKITDVLTPVSTVLLSARNLPPPQRIDVAAQLPFAKYTDFFGQSERER